MKRVFIACRHILICGIICLGFISRLAAQSCSTCASVTSFTVDISANADTTWSTSSNRNGQCCQGSGSDKCVVFHVTVSPRASEIKFTYRNGNANNGSYEINCDPLTNTSPGNSQCLGGLTSFCITYCNPGNASDAYTISTSSGFSAGADITLRNGCVGNLTIAGLLESSLTWTSVFPGAEGAYNSYLSCTSGCDSTLITPGIGAPAYIDYKVCGARTGCTLGSYCDTQRVYTVAPLLITHTPSNPVICAGGPNVTITASPSGGSSPYSYVWSNGSTTQSTTVPSGTYTVAVSDATTGCAALHDTVVVASQPAATVNAGADAAVCSGSSYSLSGSIGGSAVSSSWTTSGTGTFSNAALVAPTYTPSAADISSGSVTLTLTTSGPCAPANDAMVLSINAAAVASAGADTSICAGSTFTLSGSRGGGAASSTWTSSGTGTFNNASLLAATYTPSGADITSGIVSIIITTNDPAGPCPSASDTMLLTITQSPSSNAGIDQSVCANNANVNLNGAVTVASGGIWNTSGTGTFSPTSSTLNAVYIPSAADTATGNITLTLTTTGNGSCASVIDTLLVTITDAPVVNAGADQSVCSNNANVTLNGTVSVASGGSWSTSGTGTFSPNDTTLNATYIPSAADISSGNASITLASSGNGNCNAVSDAMTITITAPPTASAGIDQTVCGNNANISLNGSVAIASGGQWTTSGTGSFSPDGTTLNATYIPGASDISSGFVYLTLTTSGNGGCNAVTDSMYAAITPAPTANAGIDQAICRGGSITLNGSITVASGGTWSGGAGIFSPGDTILNATYSPSISEQTSGSVTLTLTTTGNATCNAVADNMIITITDTITVIAGVDQTVCANNAGVSLNGSVTGGTTTGQWSTSGSGTFSPGNSILNGVYIPSAADKAAGTVNLTLTSTGNGGCTSVSDMMIVTITPAPVVNAGVDQSVCANNATVTLNGSVTVATGRQWTTSGTGTFANDTNLSTTYNPSSADKVSGLVNLTLTSTGNGDCIPVSDQMQVTITPAPVVNAGADQPVCINNPNVSLNGSVSIATGGQWSTLGSGTFIPDNISLNATYIPSNADTSAGTVELILTSTGNVNCIAVKDTMTVTFFSHPTVSAGSNQTLCANNATVLLNGSSTTGAGTWSSSGTGTFSPNNSALNASYISSASDTSNGSVTLTLTSTNNGGCIAVSDPMTISISDAPIVNAGVDQTVCANNAAVNLSGNVNVATGGLWSTSGTGTFTSDTSFSTTYFPSATDKITGLVTLILTSTGNGNCIAVSDQAQVTVTTAPVANAGTDRLACINNPDVILNGSVTVASGGQWSTLGSGNFSPNDTTLNATYIPSGVDTSSGSVYLILATTGNGNCAVVYDTMLITYTPPPTVSAGSDQTVCANNANVLLNGTASTSTGVWSSNGTGTFSPNSSTLNATYFPSTADTANGAVALTLTTTNNAGCIAVTDQMNLSITAAPIANAGTDQSVCANNALVNLNGTITSPATGGIWTTSGSGSFSPDSVSMNASYIPGNADTTNGSVRIYLVTTGNGLCNAVSDSMSIMYTNAPNVYAGIDANVCLGTPNYILNGNSSTGSGSWTTLGSGTFSPNNLQLNATYIPGAADTASGSVTLIFTSTNNVSCNSTTDTMTIGYTPVPVVNAGTNQVVCANNASISLNGNSSTGLGNWTTSGDGIFTPNASSLNATYNAGVTDTANGTVMLTLTSVNGCIPVSENITVTITDAPVVNAGVDQFICKNNPGILLGGSVTGGASTGTWSTGGSGIFSPSDSVLNAMYIPDSTDIAASSVMFVLTSTGNGNCVAVSDSSLVTFTPSPIVSAGSDIYICNGSVASVLNGIVSAGSTTGQWTTSGSGTFSPGANTLNATYLLSPSDTAAGIITLVLTSTNSGNCFNVSDTVLVNVTAPPVTFAGSDVSVCANNASLQLNGSVVSSAGTGSWSTSGSGIFIPGDSILNAVYEPSAADISSGVVQLTLSATNACLTAPDSLMLTITPAPLVNAGADDYICSGTMTIILNGNVAGGASQGKWTTTGSGSFLPDDSTLNATYQLSTADSTAGSFQLILNSTSNGNCIVETDTMVVNITSVPVTTTGNDTAVCVNTSDVAITGLVNGGSGTGAWTTNGSGTFSPSDTSLNLVYHPSNADYISGTVRLALTATNSCVNTSDTMVLSFIPAPVANAGTDATICAGDSVLLSGLVTSAGGGMWTTSGTGNFAPDDSSLQTSYVPSTADISLGSVSFSLITTGNGNCPAASDVITATILSPVSSAAGSDTSICAGTFQLNGIVSGSGVNQWMSNGSGTFIPDDTTLNAVYEPSSADTIAGNVFLTLGISNSCFSSMDTMELSFINTPTAGAGIDQVICSGDSVILNGSVSDANVLHWITSGTGTFLPDDSSLSAEYYPGPMDLTAGYVTISFITTGSCGTATDEMTVTIIPPSIPSAGNDTDVCASGNVQLNGSVTGTASVQWTSNGSGIFSPDDSILNAVYIPSSADTVLGSVTLMLSSVNSCFNASDSVNINFASTPVADAGAGQTICAGTNALLNGSVTGTPGLQWITMGSGNFIPDDSTSNAAYAPSSSDIANGYVQLVLASDANGVCGIITDTLLIYITPPVIVNAGNDTVVCSSANLQMNAIAVAASSVHWSTSGTGTFIPDNSTVAATYQPGAADTIAGSVTLILSGINSCFSSVDTMVVTFTSTPSASAGSDQSICAGDSCALNATVSAASGFQWTSSGTGLFFPDDTSITSMYIPSPDDIVSGSVAIYLSTAATGSCGSAFDTLILSIAPSLVVFSGNDTSICTGSSVQLNGVGNGAASLQWTTSGNGTFTPGDSIPNAVYQPAQSDSASSVLLILSASNSCFNTSDTMIVSITGEAIVNAGVDFSICAGDTIALNGTANSASTIHWSTSGSGNFIPNDSMLNASYFPGSSEISSGSAMLILSGTNSCMSTTDTLQININTVPSSFAGDNQTVCEGININLSGTISNGTGGGQWTSSGNGIFIPNDTSLNTMYVPGSADTSSGFVTIILNPATGSCGAIADTMSIVIEPNPSAAFSHTPTCVNGVTGFTDVSTGSVTSWTWDFGSDTSTSEDPEVTFSSEGIHIVSLIVTSDAGCSDTLMQSVYVNPVPVALFTSLTACGDSVTFTDASTLISGNIASWYWNLGDLSYSTQQDPLHVYAAPGAYVIGLTATTDSGCTATFSDSVMVEDCDDDATFDAPVLPTAFTPNGDGHNDVLYVRGGPFNELDLRVYNEWGNEIFHGTTQAEGWDGTFNGQPQPGGKYIWTVKANSIHGDAQKLVGQVMLIRQ